jgi:hypothetical protein
MSFISVIIYHNVYGKLHTIYGHYHLKLRFKIP